MWLSGATRATVGELVTSGHGLSMAGRAAAAVAADANIATFCRAGQRMCAVSLYQSVGQQYLRARQVIVVRRTMTPMVQGEREHNQQPTGAYFLSSTSASSERDSQS